jgi:hypothetical protein
MPRLRQKGPRPIRPKTKGLRMDEPTIARVDDYRRSQSPIPNWSQAMLDLLVRGLDAFAAEAEEARR